MMKANDANALLFDRIFEHAFQQEKMHNRDMESLMNSSFDSEIDSKEARVIKKQNEEQQAAMEESKEPKKPNKKRKKEMVVQDEVGSENTAGALFICQACNKTFATKNKKK